MCSVQTRELIAVSLNLEARWFREVLGSLPQIRKPLTLAAAAIPRAAPLPPSLPLLLQLLPLLLLSLLLHPAPASSSAAAAGCQEESLGSCAAYSSGGEYVGMAYPAPVVVGPKAGGTPKATFIMMHGLGDTGDGWADVAGSMQDVLPHVKFVFPTARAQPVTLNMGMRMTSWYDIKSLQDIDQMEDEAGLLESKRYVEQLVAAEVAAGVPSEKVVVGGFSQGGAVALLMLRSDVKVAGVVALSTYLPLRKAPIVVSAANKATSVLMAHGEADVVVGHHFGKESAELLQAVGTDVQFLSFPGMGHSACPAELQAVAKFLAAHCA